MERVPVRRPYRWIFRKLASGTAIAITDQQHKRVFSKCGSVIFPTSWLDEKKVIELSKIMKIPIRIPTMNWRRSPILMIQKDMKTIFPNKVGYRTYLWPYGSHDMPVLNLATVNIQILWVTSSGSVQKKLTESNPLLSLMVYLK